MSIMCFHQSEMTLICSPKVGFFRASFKSFLMSYWAEKIEVESLCFTRKSRVFLKGERFGLLDSCIFMSSYRLILTYFSSCSIVNLRSSFVSRNKFELWFRFVALEGLMMILSIL